MRHKDFIIFIFIIFVVIFGGVMGIFVLLSNLPESSNLLNNLSITEIIEIAGIMSLAIGIIVYIGFTKALSDNYCFIRIGFESDKLITIYGVSIFSYFALAFYVVYKNPSWVTVGLITALILLLIPGFILIGYFLGKNIIIQSIEKNEVTVILMNPIQDSSGNTISELKNLKLYQTTDIDYRFKRNNEDYIIPMEQVKQIKKP